MAREIRYEMFLSKDPELAAEHAAIIIEIYAEKLPRMLAPGVALHSIMDKVSDYGYLIEDEDMKKVLALAADKYGAPRDLVKQMLDAWDDYRLLYNSVE